ncbi:MAG: ABC transporter ATP-binding protein [Myxococcota bacterium]|jgi:ABC-type multidrug transport system ATPase subunit|nr:ABC transporter ATP-binding protein [Myxococcota bacterium]
MDAGLVIQTSGLTRRFGSLTAVDRVDYQVPAGSISGLIGPNGAGKTTLISLLAGFLRPSAGTGLLLDRPLGHPEVRGRFAVLPQDATFPPRRRVADLLALYGELAGLSPAEAHAAGLDVLAAVGLQDKARERAGHLSHGMTKRLGLAQAFLGNPDLILLDEPTSGLDPRNAFEIRRLIANLKGRSTVIVSSHNLAELQSLCDHATILSRGKIVVQGPLEEITRADAEIRIGLFGEAPALAPLQSLPGVEQVELVEEGQVLLVRFSSSKTPVELGTATVLRHLLEHGALVTSLNRGRSLEQRFLELT